MRPLKYLAIAATAVLVVVIGFPDSEKPAWAHTSQVDVNWQAGGSAWVSEEIVTPVTQIGLTWDAEPPTFAAVRTLRNGSWGPWTRMTIESDHGPDPGTEEFRRHRSGTDLMWVDEADGVQFLIRGPDARDAQATVIDTTDRTKPLSRRLSDVFSPGIGSAQGAPNQPTINPKSAWDPSGSCQPKSTPSEVQVTHAFVHHTTGPNDYTTSEVASRILGICLYHTQSNGWDDIGYNFLIDRFGGIWEGRAGGIAAGVQGAHTAGFNSYSTGVAFIGEHTSTPPTIAAETALKQLLAWKFGVHNVDPTNSSVLISKGSSKWREGYPVLMKPIMGHRDAQSTSCPGEACYQRIPTYQTGVDAAWNRVPLTLYKSPLVADFDGDGQSEGALFKTTTGVWTVTERSGSTSTWADFSTAAGWSRQIVGDFNGDGKDDIANYHPSNGTWWVSRSTGSRFTTSLWADFSTATGWSRQIVGDFNGDGKDDIANYHPSNGTWWVSRSTGSRFATSLWADFSTAKGWTSQIVGDFNGDGKDDIANYHPSNGTWWVSRSTGSRFATSLWADFSTAKGWTTQIVGDFNGDGKDDIANRHGASGNWWVSRSGGSSFATAFWGTTFSYAGLGAVWTQDVNSDGKTDIVAMDSYNGILRRHRSNGSTFSITTLADTPWRTTLGHVGLRDASGSSSLVYFGQEFGWVSLSGLHAGSGTAQLVYSFPRS